MMEPTAHLDVDEPEPALEPADLAKLFSNYAKAARGTAIKNRSKGDLFGEQLAHCRAGVYEKAAELVGQCSLAAAATTMMDNARAAHVRTPPMIDFDSAGMQYNAARAWQFCARKIDPTLPEVGLSGLL